VSFSGTASYDPDGTIVDYAWDFGDGSTANGPTQFHTYNAPGIYTALLRVTDNLGATASTTQSISVQPLAAPVLSGSLIGNVVNLSWTDSAGATGWLVERKQGETGSWTQIASVSTRSYSETRPHGNWFYRVRAFNSEVVSPYSNVVLMRVRP
jgi:PKD repeat protein